MKVKDVMSRNATCCGSDTPLQDVAAMMVDCDCGEIPVTDTRGHLVGVVTDRDITCRAVAQGRNPLDMTAADVMTSPAITVDADLTVKDCCDTLERNQIRRVPVVDASGACIGIVSLADIAREASGRKTAEVVKEVSKPSVGAAART
ncbi:MAG TPA: CBS domain-containing protein [Vicinamibacteria bacterium]|nr:CBS domain-containing protein [Vicinamibacteria bacterium]